jgi:hypothetical protein
MAIGPREGQSVKRLFSLLIAMTTVTAACSSSNSPTAASRTPESPTGSPAVAGPTPLPKSGVISPGTYATNFQPRMAFTAASSGWEVDVDTPGWVAMEFTPSAPVLGFLSITDVTKVFDPKHDGKLIDPPKDLAGWIGELPGLKVVAPPTPVTVGGVEGKQLDVLIGPEDVGVGPIQGARIGNGFPKNHAVRIIVVSVDGQDVQISFDAEDAGSKYFGAAVDHVQPLIDSITWG